MEEQRTDQTEGMEGKGKGGTIENGKGKEMKESKRQVKLALIFFLFFSFFFPDRAR
jgi:hypothetical protein